eukprot:gene8501-4860_t
MIEYSCVLPSNRVSEPTVGPHWPARFHVDSFVARIRRIHSMIDGLGDFDLDLGFDISFNDNGYSYDYGNDEAVGDYNFGEETYDYAYTSSSDYETSFDPSSNPRVEFRLLFPNLSISSRPGGQTKFMRDLQGTLASAAQVPSTSAVITFIPSSGRRLSLLSAKTEVSAVVWFDANYEDVPSEISSMSAFEFFELQLRKSPSAIFRTSALSNIASTVQVQDLIVLQATGGDSGYYPDLYVDYGDDYIAVVDFDISGRGFESEDGGNNDYEYSAEDLLASAVLDFGDSEPVIELLGEAYVEVPEWDSFPYEDDGALMMDSIDGTSFASHAIFQCQRVENIEELAYLMEAKQLLPILNCNESELAYLMVAKQILPMLNCNKSVNRVDVSRPAVSTEVFVILYAGRNSQGTAAALALRVVALFSRCLEPERWCPALDPAGCSYFGRYISLGEGSISDGYSQGVTATAIVIGTTLPRVTLLGTGQAALTSTGETMMLDEIPFDSKWVDPGATAIGYPYGEPVDITASVTSFGAGAVDTLLATPPSMTYSFLITYTAVDEVGNQASPARRLIKVNCIPPSELCVNPSNGKPTCTVDGFCGLPPSLTRTSVTVIGATEIDTSAPNLTLQGPPVMTIPQATAYSRCPKGSPVGSLCDAGATAEDFKDGPLTQNIKVCGYPFVKSARSTSPLVPILLACNITIRYPGTFTIDFSVTNSAGLTSRVERTLVVESVCLPGARLCNNLLDCSVQGTCESELAVTELEERSKVPGPIISLVTFPFLGESVELCEPGAVAFEFSLAGAGATLEDANNVTQRIVACPRPDCLLGAPCSTVDLGAMSLLNRGLGGCKVDTLAPIGTIFPVAFWVWDYGVPAMRSVVVRKVVISKPCPDPAKPNFCRDGSRFYCSPSDCKTSEAYLPDPTEVPVLRLLPLDTSTVFIELGNVPPFSLAPCPSLTQNSSCGSVAYTKYPGSLDIIQDLTSKIKVTSTTNCKDNPTTCRGCTMAQMSLGGGLCLVGTYKVRYSITFDQTGVTRYMERTVIIYNTSYSDFPGTRVYDSLTNFSLAGNVVDAINSGNKSRSEFMQAQNRVATAVLTQLNLRGANVELFNATLLRRMVEVHGWMALADTDWLMQQTRKLDTNDCPSPWDMYLSEDKSPAMPLASMVNEVESPTYSNEHGQEDEGLHFDESHMGDLGVADVGTMQLESRRLLQQDPYTAAVFSIVALAEGMGDQAVDMYASASKMAGDVAVRLVPIKRIEDAGAAQIQSNFSALIQDAKAEQQMVMDKSDTVMSLLNANIAALNKLVIQASETATVLRDVIAETEAARMSDIRETLVVQAFNARSDPDVPNIDCFELTQDYKRSFVINTYGQYTGTTTSNSSEGRRRKVNPVHFGNWSSTLYDTGLLNQYDLYYNTSNSSEVGPNGVPLGFRWRNMKVYENGFPVLFENRMIKEQAANVMQYLMDGNYLDDQTKGMTAEILSYNRDLHVLGYARGNFKWMLDGSIKVKWEFLGLPALDYLKDSDNILQDNLKVFGKELVPLWILIGFFTLYTIWHLVDSIHYYGRVEASHHVGAEWSLKRGLGALPTDSKLVYDLLLVGVMVAGGVVWSLYMGKYAMEFEARYTYNVYDSVTGRANWLLPIREDAVAIQEATTIESLLTGSLTATTAGIDNDLLDSLNISAPWSAGMAGRYLLPEADDPNMDDLSEVMSMAHTLASYYTTYGILQAVVIVMLILRLISSFSFQQRLGIIGDTLIRAMPLLFHIFLLILVVLLMFAVAAYIMLGWRRVEVATYTDALQDTALSLVDVSRMQDTTNAFLSDSHSFKTLVDAGDDDTPLGLIVLPIEHFVVALMSIFSFFFMQNVLLVFLLAHLLDVFSNLKSDHAKGNAVGSSCSVLSDLQHTVFPSIWIRFHRLFRKPALAIMGASGGRVSQHPDDSDGPTTKDKSQPRTFDEMRKFLSDNIPPGVNQHNGAMQQVKGVRVGAVYIDEHMTLALLIATALEMEQSKHGARKKGILDDSQYQKVLIRALEAATELHKSMGHTLHVPLRNLVQGPTSAIHDRGRPIAEDIEAGEEEGEEHPAPKTVVPRRPHKGAKRAANKALVTLENNKVATSSDSQVEVSQHTNSPLKKSYESEGPRAGNTAEKYLQAGNLPRRASVAWDGPLEKDLLVGLSVPCTSRENSSEVEVFRAGNTAGKDSQSVRIPRRTSVAWEVPCGQEELVRTSWKKSSEVEVFRAGKTVEKGPQAVSFPGQITIAWEGPMKRDDLMELTVPCTMTQVPFLQLPHQTLMQMLDEGFPDPKTSHWTSNFHGPQLMNVTMPAKSGAHLLHTRNQLFNMLVRAVVATARWQQLVAEWQAKSWDETRVALGHNAVRVQHFGKSGSSQDGEEEGEEHPAPKTVVPRRPHKGAKRAANKALVTLENNKVATSSDSQVEVSQHTNSPLKKSYESEGPRAGNTAEKYLQAGNLPRRASVAWDGPLEKDLLVGQSVPCTSRENSSEVEVFRAGNTAGKDSQSVRIPRRTSVAWEVPCGQEELVRTSWKKSSEVEVFRAGKTVEKGPQAVSFPGQITIAWEGPMKRDDLMELTVPCTMTQVPFLQLPHQTLMQMLDEGFPDPKTSHWTSNFHGPQLMNVTMPAKSGAHLLHTRNQLFNMLVRAVVATARWQQLVAEWQAKSWDETRVALGHNAVRVQRFGKSGSSQDAKSIEDLPGLHTPADLSSRRTSLASAIEVVEKGHPLLWHSCMDPVTTNIDPDVARLWPEMMLRFDGARIDALRGLSLTPPDADISSTASSTSLNPSSRPSQTLKSMSSAPMYAGISSIGPRTRSNPSFSTSQPLKTMSSTPTYAGISSIASRGRYNLSSSTSQPLLSSHDEGSERDPFDTVRDGAKLGRTDSKEKDPELPHQVSGGGGWLVGDVNDSEVVSTPDPVPKILKDSSLGKLPMPRISKPVDLSSSRQQPAYNFGMQPGGLPMPRISKLGGPSSSKQLPMPPKSKPGGPSASMQPAAYNFDMQPGGLPMPKISKPGGPSASKQLPMPPISKLGGPSSSMQPAAYNFDMQPGGLPMPKISKMGPGDASARMSSGKISITGQARRAAKRSPCNAALLGTIQGDDWEDRAREADVGLDELQQQWSIGPVEMEMIKVNSIKSLADVAQ